MLLSAKSGEDDGHVSLDRNQPDYARASKNFSPGYFAAHGRACAETVPDPGLVVNQQPRRYSIRSALLAARDE